MQSRNLKQLVYVAGITDLLSISCHFHRSVSLQGKDLPAKQIKRKINGLSSLRPASVFCGRAQGLPSSVKRCVGRRLLRVLVLPLTVSIQHQTGAHQRFTAM